MTYREIVKLLESLSKNRKSEQPFPKKYWSLLPENIGSSVVSFDRKGDKIFVSLQETVDFGSGSNVTYIGSANKHHIYAIGAEVDEKL